MVQSSEDLFDAVTQGDAIAVEEILIRRSDSGVPDHAGRPLLFQALQCGHTQVAACLLAYGADPAPLKDTQIPHQLLHAVRQRYHRFQRRARAEAVASRTDIERTARELKERGIVKISGLIPPADLNRMQRDFRKFVVELQVRVARGTGIYRHYDEELHLWGQDRAFITNNAFKYSAELVRVCCDELIAGVANRYLRSEAHIQRAVGMRYLPLETTERDMFGWHHDMEEQRMKLMILLTDVSESDQYMSYVIGSHRLFHPYEMFFENRCSLDYCRAHLGEPQIFKTTGKAGDAFLFDSNGAHRGNRAPEAAVRDAFFIEYSADNSQVWGGDIDPIVLESVPAQNRRPLARMMAVEKKWNLPGERGKTPDWIRTLPQIESWL